MQTNPSNTIKIETADPSSLALFGLAMVTLVASTQKMGVTEGLSLIIPWAIFLGGGAQLRLPRLGGRRRLQRREQGAGQGRY